MTTPERQLEAPFTEKHPLGSFAEAFLNRRTHGRNTSDLSEHE